MEYASWFLDSKVCYFLLRMWCILQFYIIVNQCLSPLKLWVWTLFMARCTCDSLVVVSGYSDFLTNKTDRHDITEILLKVALNTINLHYCNISLLTYYTSFTRFTRKLALTELMSSKCKTNLPGISQFIVIVFEPQFSFDKNKYPSHIRFFSKMELSYFHLS